MGRISRSWQLVKASWAVLRADKELLLFPVASGIASFAVVVVLFLGWVGSGGLDRLDGDGVGLVDLILLYVFYFITSSVVIFFNSALIAAANIRLDGGDPTLSDGFRIAFSHLPAILGWAAIAATVGLILQALRERGGALGFVVSLIGGMAWGLITYLVVPILVVEGIGPVDAIKRSASLLRKTWGEQIVGNFSIGLVIGLAFIGVAVAGGLITARALQRLRGARCVGSHRARRRAHHPRADRCGPLGYLQHRALSVRCRQGFGRPLPAGDPRRGVPCPLTPFTSRGAATGTGVVGICSI